MIVFKGGPQMTAQLRKIQTQFPTVVGAALYQEGQIEMTESKRICPVDVTPPMPHPGLLRSTGTVQKPKQEGDRVYVDLTYGTDYAVYVHEILENYHPVGQARFLASVMEESAPSMAGRVGTKIKELLTRQGKGSSDVS